MANIIHHLPIIGEFRHCCCLLTVGLALLKALCNPADTSHAALGARSAWGNVGDGAHVQAVRSSRRGG